LHKIAIIFSLKFLLIIVLRDKVLAGHSGAGLQALGGQWQENFKFEASLGYIHSEFEASPGFIARLCLKMKQQNRAECWWLTPVILVT
jgi:hypothetical protein